jgi:uncharacterized protein YdiU (UPF0061 family)
MIKYNQMKEKKINNEEFESGKRKRLVDWVSKYKFRLRKEVEYFNALKKGQKIDDHYNLTENFLEKFNIRSEPFSEFIFKDIYSNIYERFKTDNIPDIKEFVRIREAQMKSLNPKFILRNHLAQKVITEADNNNYQELEKLLSILIDPFSEHFEYEEEKLYSTSLEKAFSICVSCSS